MSLNGNLIVPDGGYIYGNTSYGVLNIGKEEQVININGYPNFTNTLNQLNVDTLGVNSISSINNTLNILGETINIGPFNDIPNIINIGNELSVVNILGTSTYTFTNIVAQTVGSPILILNTDISNNPTGQFSGIQINSISGPGIIITNDDSTKYLIKAPLNTVNSYIATTDLNNNFSVTGKLNVGHIHDVETVLNNKVNTSTLSNYYTSQYIDSKCYINALTGFSMFVSITEQSNITTLNVINTSHLIGNVTAYSKLNVVGKTTLDDSLFVKGSIISNSIAAVSSFSVIGKSIFNGNVTMNSTLNVDKLITDNYFLKGSVTIPSMLSVGENVYVNNNLFVTGNSFIQGDNSIAGALYVGEEVVMNNRLSVYGNINTNSNFTANNIGVNNIAADGNILSLGNITTNKYLVANNILSYKDLTVNGGVSIHSTMSVLGSVTMASDLTILGHLNLNTINVKKNLNVSGSITANNDLYVGDSIYAGGMLNINSGISNHSNLAVAGSITTNSDLSVGGNVNTTGNVKVRGIINTDGPMTVNDTIYGKNDFNLSGNAIINGDLAVVGNIVGNFQFNENISILSNLAVAGSITTNSDLSVGGNVNTTGNVNTNGNMKVKGIINTDGPMTVNNTIYGKKDFNLSGDAIINGNMNVKGNILGNFAFQQGVSMLSNLAVAGSITTNNNLSVHNNAMIGGVLNVNGDINTNGNIRVSDNLIVNKNLSAYGSTTFNGPINFNGPIYGIEQLYVKSLGVGGITDVEAAINSKIDESALLPYLTKKQAHETYMPLSATSALNINGYDLTKINFSILGTNTTILRDQWVSGIIGIAQTEEFTITLPSAFEIIHTSFSNMAPYGFCFHTYLNYQLGTGRYNININTTNNKTSMTTIYDGFGFTKPITDILTINIEQSYAPIFKSFSTHFITRIDNSTSMTIFKL